MISIMLLALPILCLLIGVAYFSVALWRLNKKSISSAASESPTPTPVTLEKHGRKIISQAVTISDDIQIANSHELDEETIKILLNTALLKQHEEIHRLENIDVVSKNISDSIDTVYMSSKLLKNRLTATRFDNVFQNKEKFLCHLQNLG